jgi:hypothetical protein
MQKAQDIVNRYTARGNLLPRELRDHQHDPCREQEYRDAQKLNKWKQALGGKTGHACSDELRDFLDKSMPSWRQEIRKHYSDPMQKAADIVERYRARGFILPRQFRSGNDPLRQQENKDARKLYDWKQALKGLRFYKCSDELRDFLDTEMQGWRQNVKEVHTNPMQKAMDIVDRYRLNGCLLPRQYKNGTDTQRVQENKDAQKLYNWKEAMNGKRGKCSDAVRDYLDVEMPGWRTESSARGGSGSGSGSGSSSGSGTCRAGFVELSGGGRDDCDDVCEGKRKHGDLLSTMEFHQQYQHQHQQQYHQHQQQQQSQGWEPVLQQLQPGWEACAGQGQHSEEEQARVLKQIRMDSELLLGLNHGAGAVAVTAGCAPSGEMS